jgi:hypothetical protein
MVQRDWFQLVNSSFHCRVKLLPMPLVPLFRLYFQSL